jgi:hypothetical protein
MGKADYLMLSALHSPLFECQTAYIPDKFKQTHTLKMTVSLKASYESSRNRNKRRIQEPTTMTSLHVHKQEQKEEQDSGTLSTP